MAANDEKDYDETSKHVYLLCVEPLHHSYVSLDAQVEHQSAEREAI